MKASQSIRWSGCLLALLLAPISFAEDNREATPTEASGIELSFEGLRSNVGNLTVFLFADAKGFPLDSDRAIATIELVIDASGEARGRFSNLPPGAYAIAAVHDENDNDRLDENFLCLPVEGYGMSNNARGLLGLPPSFKNARFWLESAGLVHPTIQIRY